MKADLIVSRHPGAVVWLRETYPELTAVPVVDQTTAANVRGKTVVGNLPLHLACVAECVHAIEFAGAPPRGAEYGAAEMRAAGARLVAYHVRAAATACPDCDGRGPATGCGGLSGYEGPCHTGPRGVDL